jgi:hypothetical protein
MIFLLLVRIIEEKFLYGDVSILMDVANVQL